MAHVRRLSTLWTLALASACTDATEPTQTDLQISGQVTSNATWQDHVLLTGDAEIAPGVTIEVTPGTVFEAADGAVLRVRGTLSLEGTESDPIELIVESGGIDWAGFIAAAGGAVRIHHVTASRVATLLTCETGAAECVIENARLTDIARALDASSDASIANSVFEDVSVNAVEVHAGGDVSITDTSMRGAPGDLVVVSGGALTMSYCDLGSDLTEEHGSVFIPISTHVSISYCNIASAEYGITIGYTSNASINNNNFLDNQTDVASLGSNVSIDMSSNYWDSGTPVGLGGEFSFAMPSPTPISGAGPRVD